MLALAIILIYLFVIALILWVIEPFLRLRLGWMFIKYNDYIIDRDSDRQFIGALILTFWPIGIPLFFIIKYVFAHLLVYTYLGIKYINKASEKFWTPKPKIDPENVVDETKSDYRNFSLIERK